MRAQPELLTEKRGMKELMRATKRSKGGDGLVKSFAEGSAGPAVKEEQVADPQAARSALDRQEKAIAAAIASVKRQKVSLDGFFLSFTARGCVGCV